jgi:ankyrin repeat protein
MASMKGALEVARVLLEHGANVQAEDGEGRTPLQIVSEIHDEMTRSSMTKFLVEHGAK